MRVAIDLIAHQRQCVSRFDSAHVGEVRRLVACDGNTHLVVSLVRKISSDECAKWNATWLKQFVCNRCALKNAAFHLELSPGDDEEIRLMDVAVVSRYSLELLHFVLNVFRLTRSTRTVDEKREGHISRLNL